MSDQYVSRKEVSTSYRPRNSLMSPGLLRARAPFRVRNAITGLILAAFGVGVWAYSISAVKQDDFSDIDEEAKEMMKGRTALAGSGSDSGSGSGSDSSASIASRATGPKVHIAPESASSPPPSSSEKPRGVLAPILDRTFPRLLDPTRKTLVWGAPPIDNIGKLQLRSSSEGRR